MVVSHEQLESKLRNAGDYFRIRPADDVNAFILYVRPRFQVSILKRIEQDTIEDADTLTLELR